MRRLAILSTLFILTPVLVFAHGTRYLEFSPDQASSLKVGSVNTPSQVFYVQNDFLGGADFWVSNPGVASTATFSLLNEQGSVLTSRTVAIPTIAETANGTRFHVDFNSQLSVLADDKYSIRITSSMPEFRLYYSNRVYLVSYSTPFLSEYITGIGRLGSEEQTFSFKYALYETNETSAPIISNVGWTVVSSDEMKVDFNANEPVDYKIDYGPSGQGYTSSTNFLNSYRFCAEGISLCSLNIQVLPGTTYDYTLTVKDSWGNQSQVTGTFISGQGQAPAPTTSSGPTPTASPTPTPDTSAPVITNLRIAESTANSVGVAWTTNEPANSFMVVRYSGNLSAGGVSDPVIELEHFLELGNLSPFVQYRAEVTSGDADGNEAQASISFTLTGEPTPTPSQSPPPPTSSPQPTSSELPPTATPTPTVTLTGNGTIQWSPPSSGEPSDGYRIDVFDKEGNLIKTVIVSPGSHSVDIPGLKEGEYSVIVYANNNEVFKKVDKPASLKIEPSFMKRLLGFWWALIPLLVGLGYLIWKNLKKKVSSPQITTKVLP